MENIKENLTDGFIGNHDQHGSVMHDQITPEERQGVTEHVKGNLSANDLQLVYWALRSSSPSLPHR